MINSLLMCLFKIIWFYLLTHSPGELSVNDKNPKFHIGMSIKRVFFIIGIFDA